MAHAAMNVRFVAVALRPKVVRVLDSCQRVVPEVVGAHAALNRSWGWWINETNKVSVSVSAPLVNVVALLVFLNSRMTGLGCTQKKKVWRHVSI